MKLVHNCCSQFSLVKICYVKSDIRKTKICFTNFAASDNYTSALSQDSHRCIGLNVYERSKKIFLEDRKIAVCQLITGRLAGRADCCFQQNIGDIDLWRFSDCVFVWLKVSRAEPWPWLISSTGIQVCCQSVGTDGILVPVSAGCFIRYWCSSVSSKNHQYITEGGTGDQ